MSYFVQKGKDQFFSVPTTGQSSTTIHNIPLLHDQVKVGVEEVKDVDARILVPTEEVKLVGQAPNTFFACLTHLVKRLSEQVFRCH